LMAVLLPRFAPWFVAACCVLALVAAPWLPLFLPSILPASVGDSLSAALVNAHAQERLLIWKAFAFLARSAPPEGLGVGATRIGEALPLAASVPAELRHELHWGHPHSLGLQTWIELGWPGVVLVGVLIVVVAMALTRRDRRDAAFGAALLATIFAIASVSHGAWQGWWIALVAFAGLIADRAGSNALPPRA
jgi:O-antigen ligase